MPLNERLLELLFLELLSDFGFVIWSFEEG
jgi:hypothetical protein